MNKVVTPKQLELTAGKTREELLFLSAPQEAARAVSAPAMGSGFAFGYRADLSDDDFNWDSTEEDAVILREQRATAAYRNKAGELIIRQRASWDEDRDTFVFISPENEVAFMEGIAKRARE